MNRLAEESTDEGEEDENWCSTLPETQDVRRAPLPPQPTTAQKRVQKQDSYSKAIKSGTSTFATPPLRNNTAAAMSSITNYNNNRNIQPVSNAPKNISDSYTHPGYNSEAEAAIVIQSAFKGYKVRREIQEIQTFYQQLYRSESGRPADFRNEPLSKKRRQDSYMKAMSSMSQDDDESDFSKKNKESWKLRQDSYLRAIGKSTDNDGHDDRNNITAKPKRQDSYLQAIKSSEPEVFQGKRWGHQDSYLMAVGNISPDSHTDEESELQSNGAIFKANGKHIEEDELPDLNCANVADAALKIQAAFRGFQVRKKVKETEGDLPDLIPLSVTFCKNMVLLAPRQRLILTQCTQTHSMTYGPTIIHYGK